LLYVTAYVVNSLNKHFIFVLCFSYNKICLQNWGDIADVTQGVVIYLLYSSDVLLICWLGTKLTQYVRQKELFLFLFTFLKKKYYVDEQNENRILSVYR